MRLPSSRGIPLNRSTTDPLTPSHRVSWDRPASYLAPPRRLSSLGIAVEIHSTPSHRVHISDIDPFFELLRIQEEPGGSAADDDAEPRQQTGPVSAERRA